MKGTTEPITAGGVELTLRLPESYDREPGRRYPLLLALDRGIGTAECVRTLREEGILPEMLVAEPTKDGGPCNPVAAVQDLAATHRVLEDPSARWIAGTGHGAAAALQSVLDHPEIMGRAACLSTSMEGTEGAPPAHSRLLRELEERAHLPRGVRLFLDYGTQGLDECYEPYHRDFGAILRGRGWKDGGEFLIMRIPGGTHDGASWSDRLGPALRWLAGR